MRTDLVDQLARRLVPSTLVALVAVAGPIGAQTFVGEDRTPRLCDSCAWRVRRVDTLSRLFPADSSMWFGYPFRIATNGQGIMVVSDPYKHSVARVDLELGRAVWMGREGSGPGEMGSPLNVALDSAGRSYIYDPKLMRLSQFDANGEFVKGFQVEPGLSVSAVAANGEEVVYLGAPPVFNGSRPALIHESRMNGQHLRSYGEPHRDVVGADAKRLDGGPLWYDDTSDMLWLSRRGEGVRIELYRHGALQHTTELSDVRFENKSEPWIETGEDGRVTVSPPKTLGSFALFPLGEEYVVNVAIADKDDSKRIDLFRRVDGRHLYGWLEPPSEYIYTFGLPKSYFDGPHRYTVLAISMELPDIYLLTVEISANN